MEQTTRCLVVWSMLVMVAGCSSDGAAPDAGKADAGPPADQATADAPVTDALPPPPCTFVDAGVGPAGKTKLTVEVVATGLVMPWGLAFPSATDVLITEMPGRLRLVRGGKLLSAPVVKVNAPGGTPGQGMQGVVLHPKFASNRLLYLHYWVEQDGKDFNRVVRYKLAADGKSATLDKVILDKIPSGPWHNGGRMRFGADGMLYISTGDAHNADDSQDKSSLAGKILRVTDEGKVPADNPWAGKAAIISGIRNSQGFDFYDAKTLYVVDHGPSGEYGRTGQDEVNLAAFGDNLGWPTISGCTKATGKLPPSLSWKTAVPPGSALLYRGDKIAGWKGSLLVTVLLEKALMRVVFDKQNPRKVVSHELYLRGDPPAGYGRLRTAELGPDGQLYLLTSNCDDHGSCSGPKDQLLRIK